MDILYTAVAHATGDGRNGHATSDDGVVDVEMRIPKELGGPGGGTNPEQLFAAGYAACFHSALKFAAGPMGADTTDSEVSASVGIGLVEGGGLGLSVELDVDLPKMERDAAEALVARAHAVCPYSNATRGNIDVTLRVI
jgi:osmotically inducible protein OsmC